MEDYQLTESELEFAAKMWGLSEEDKKNLPKFKTYHKRFFKLMQTDAFHNYKIIQEVVEAKNCPRQAIVGGKIVYTAMGQLMPSECTAFPVTGFCTLAITTAMSIFGFMVNDRTMAGLTGDDLNPNLNYFGCPRGALEEGGLGSVLFKVYVVEANPSSG